MFECVFEHVAHLTVPGPRRARSGLGRARVVHGQGDPHPPLRRPSQAETGVCLLAAGLLAAACVALLRRRAA